MMLLRQYLTQVAALYGVVPPLVNEYWLLEDGTSFWLLEDGTSKWLLET